MNTITLKEVLNTIDTHREQPFDITFIKADVRRKVAGKSATYQQVVLHSIDRDNSIRRVLLKNGKVRAIHIRLITHYNNQLVIY
ncbi:hypothetical protein QNI16_07275 [Cytophagaceae bacterium YF14B1]|uniref:Uncharacterized protein n=1 Tax=Xanthocytophaga flava TaxID=3048013 RepID=A0AAE3QNG9_9BACT|nr:hypothetical protein [Xanthocytophaga flavus]MDJ1480280.1 hypothetical protein [Xanthocytophaga flavus]